MIWDIASIVFVCVTMNHLGLISAIESSIGCKLWIVDCPKCSSFWATLVYLGCGDATTYGAVTVLAISFLASYAAIWLELMEGIVDTLYNKVYETIYTDTDNDETSADGDKDDTNSGVS
jgi:hypothetical protein